MIVGLRLQACLLAVLLAMCGVAHACYCAPSIDVHDMRAAKHVVVVRVTATAVPSDDGVRFGVALVRVIDQLRGNAAPKQLRYSLGSCCPLRIEAGRDYIVFSDTAEITDSVHAGNLVALPGFGAYDRKDDGRNWREILAGKRALPMEHVMQQLQQLGGM